MRIFTPAILLLAASATAVKTDITASSTHPPACTATSASGSGAFFDLSPDIAARPVKGKTPKGPVTKDYKSRGYDYGKNFTLNICGAVVDPVHDVEGIKKSQWANISAYYTSHGKTYSIGSQSMDLHSRGRKLVLQYTGGSPCGKPKSGKAKRSPDRNSFIYDDEDSTPIPKSPEGESLAASSSHSSSSTDDSTTQRRKSATISFLCDRDPLNNQASVSFVGTDPDECAYFFEARSLHACAHAEPHKKGSVGPGSVFGLILVIAVLVYALGGVFYNRTVTHARGWRQLPNYSLWAGIWSFITDMFVILLSSCSRCLPGRRGYSNLNAGASARHRNTDAENRLIDQLDEEWDD